LVSTLLGKIHYLVKFKVHFPSLVGYKVLKKESRGSEGKIDNIWERKGGGARK